LGEHDERHRFGRIDDEIRGRDPYQWFTPDHAATLHGTVALRNRQIQPVRFQRGEEFATHPSLQLALDARIGACEAGQQAWRLVGNEIVGDAQSQCAHQVAVKQFFFEKKNQKTFVRLG
jgi:hypothetical protein